MERSKVDIPQVDAAASRQAMLARVATDPVGLIGALLRGSGQAMRASEIKDWLVGLGVAPRVVDVLWPAVRRPLRMSANVSVRGWPCRYRWVGSVRGPRRGDVSTHSHVLSQQPEDLSQQPEDLLRQSQVDRAAELERALAKAEAELATANARADSAELRVKELAARSEHLEEVLRQEHTRSLTLRSAQQRQLQIDVIRTLADLAAEVEELATDQFGPDVLVDRVRALVSAQALEPIGSAGATLPFDRDLHVPAIGTLEPGTMATVIRPGYRWHFADEDLVINKALVSVT